MPYTYFVCPECHEEVGSNDIHCNHCGISLLMADLEQRAKYYKEDYCSYCRGTNTYQVDIKIVDMHFSKGYTQFTMFCKDCQKSYVHNTNTG